jgi:hypothetical protein
MANQFESELSMRRNRNGVGIISAVELAEKVIVLFGEKLIDVLPQSTQ